ncbi:MAG: ABC transporter substrate-binding protein [Prochloron sp. SP5CPC1]|nr:ABC transporter substrate-binding protein [Candidatus Paraprochloron terpiosi SP5CPC1]
MTIMQQHTKKLLLVITFLVTLLLTQIAFSQEPAVQLQVLMGPSGAARWQPFITEFQEQNPNIRVKITEGPNATNVLEDLYTGSFLLGNSPYDLVYMDIVWVPKFAAAGWLLPLDNFLTEGEVAEFLLGDVNGGRYKGKLYRMPLRSDAGMLYYRQDLLAAEGYEPPETFSELLEIAQALQSEEVPWGYVWQGKQYEGLAAMFVEILQGHGAFWVDPETLEVGLDRPEAIKAVKFLRQTVKEGISPPGVTTYQEEETRLLFQNGKAVFLRNWPYVFSLASQDNSPIQGKFAIKPMPSAPGQPSGACQGGWGMGIAATSKHPDAAWKLIQFMSSEEVQRRFILDNGYVPSRKSLFNDPEIVAKYNHYPELLKVVESSALRPPIPQYAQASDILQRYLSAALTDRMSPEKAMAAAANETRRLLGVSKPQGVEKI